MALVGLLLLSRDKGEAKLEEEEEAKREDDRESGQPTLKRRRRRWMIDYRERCIHLEPPSVVKS